MTGLSLSLVLLASLAHSTWNLLLKRSGDKEVFVWCLLVAASLMLVPVGAVLLWFNPIQGTGWWFVLATILLHILYFVLLGRSYEQGDLSLVYPIARGVGPMLVPGMAVVFLGESVALPAIFGIATIVAGIYILAWWGNFRMVLRRPLQFLANNATRYALLTGVTIAAYALVDKRGVGQVQPFVYMYLMTLGSAVDLTPYIFHAKGIGAIQREWRANFVPILAAGLLTFLGYGLVLTAFSISRVSYVAPAREVSIVIGVLMGVFLLKERFGAGRLLGSGFILGGLVLIALSP